MDALFGVIGTLGGVVLGFLLSRFSAWRTRKDRAAFLAQRVTLALDEFVAQVAADLTYYDGSVDDDRPERSGRHPGPLVLPNDVDWTSIEPGLAYALQKLPYHVAQATGRISSLAQVDSIAAVEDMHRCFRDLALDADDLSNRLRKVGRLPSREESDWDPVAELRAHPVQGAPRHPVDPAK